LAFPRLADSIGCSCADDADDLPVHRFIVEILDFVSGMESVPSERERCQNDANREHEVANPVGCGVTAAMKRSLAAGGWL